MPDPVLDAPHPFPDGASPALLQRRPFRGAAAATVTAIELAVPRVGLTIGLAAGQRVLTELTSCTRMPADTLTRTYSEQCDAWWMVELAGPDAGVLLASAEVVTGLADLLMGGSGVPSGAPSSPLERSVLRRHLDAGLAPVRSALAEHGTPALSLLDPPAGSDGLSAELGGADLLAVVIAVGLPGDDVARPGPGLVLALPVRAVLGGDADTGSPEPAAVLGEIPLTLRVRFPSTWLSGADVNNLETGDVVRMDLTEPTVEAYLDDGAERTGTAGLLLTGALGRRGRRRAVVVDHVTDPR